MLFKCTYHDEQRTNDANRKTADEQSGVSSVTSADSLAGCQVTADQTSAQFSRRKMRAKEADVAGKMRVTNARSRSRFSINSFHSPRSFRHKNDWKTIKFAAIRTGAVKTTTNDQ